VNDAVRRAKLLDAAADYVLANGVSTLSVRPLAAHLGLSHRTMLYHFASKDDLLVEVLDVIRTRDAETIRAYLGRAKSDAPQDLLRAAWRHFSAPARMPYARFFHEVLALGLQAGPYRRFVERVADARTAAIAAALQAAGLPPKKTRAIATLITAAVRGLQLHLLATGDRATADAAFEELLSVLESSSCRTATRSRRTRTAGIASAGRTSSRRSRSSAAARSAKS
jgi:AcrR family transcriptional regulator